MTNDTQTLTARIQRLLGPLRRRGAASTLLALAVIGVAVAAIQTPAVQEEFQQRFSSQPAPVTDDEYTNGACTPLRVNGDPRDKADIVLVGKGYDSDQVMRTDFEYFMDFDGNNRGLFAIPPFDEDSNREKFNVWTINAEDAIGDYGDARIGRGLVTDARDWFGKCPHADYKAVLAKEGMGRGGFTLQGHRLFVKDVHRKVMRNQGAAGFLHEWGHAFGQLKDEYYKNDGRDASGKPNCASSREQAEQWWGYLAEQYNDVGYYQGCAYTKDNWRPHRQSIMGNGGLHSYGRVGERRMREALEQYQ